MYKSLLTVVFSIFLFTFVHNVSGQNSFYSREFLKSDFNQVDVVAHVKIKSHELVDQIGEGKCEQITGKGYCLYRLKAEVKEIFKGKIESKAFEFYIVTEARNRVKDFFSGEKVVFLNWSDNYPDKKMSLGTLENSTRSIEYDVLRKLRKIARKK